MEYSLSDQLITFFCSVLCGFCLGVFYEILRLVRKLLPSKKYIVVICDLIFMLVLSFVSVLFSICYSRGNTRYFTIIGELAGILAVRFTLGTFSIRFFLPLVQKTLKKCRKIAGNMGKTLKKLLQGAGNILYNKYRNRASVNKDKASTKTKSRGKRYHGVKTAEE